MNRLAIIVLCKDNHADLSSTLRSIFDHARSAQIIIYDGSQNRILSEHQVSDYVDKCFPSLVYVHDSLTSGIYPSMNASLQHVSANSLMFLNSGDILIGDPFLLVSLREEKCVDCVFASVQIFTKRRMLYEYPAQKI